MRKGCDQGLDLKNYKAKSVKLRMHLLTIHAMQHSPSSDFSSMVNRWHYSMFRLILLFIAPVHGIAWHSALLLFTRVCIRLDTGNSSLENQYTFRKMKPSSNVECPCTMARAPTLCVHVMTERLTSLGDKESNVREQPFTLRLLKQ